MDGQKKEKVRRIYAWIAVILFILLIVNLSTVQYQLGISVGIYLCIIMFYLFFLRKRKDEELPEAEENPESSEKEK